MARTRQLNIRVPEKLSEELAAIAEEQGLDKADVARQMLVRSVRGYRLERAIRRYREGEITMARAAEDTGLSLYDMTVSYTHLRAHETRHELVCRLLLEKKKKNTGNKLP